MKPLFIQTTDEQAVKYREILRAAGCKISHHFEGATSMAGWPGLQVHGSDKTVCRGKARYGNQGVKIVTIGEAVDILMEEDKAAVEIALAQEALDAAIQASLVAAEASKRAQAVENDARQRLQILKGR